MHYAWPRFQSWFDKCEKFGCRQEKTVLSAHISYFLCKNNPWPDLREVQFSP